MSVEEVYSVVDLKQSPKTPSAKQVELYKFLEVNRENLKYSKRGYRETLRQAFQEQSGIQITDCSFRQYLTQFRKTHDCPLEISTPHYKSSKNRN